MTNKDFPLFPRTAAYLHRISYLFPNKIYAWPVYYISIKNKLNDDWVILKEEDYFGLKPFGHRTRLNKALSGSYYSIGYDRGRQRALERRKNLAIWIKGKYESKNTNNAEVEEVKLLLYLYDMSNESSFDGHWKKPDFDKIDPYSPITLFRYKF